ncbi:MAG: translation factor Sua5, partial [Rhizobiaceae bacterium]|nr:translation factor Sua5 [Rhizobiaceae bacterium]
AIRLLRPGGVAAAEIESIAGASVRRGGDRIEAPGMLSSHYAPRAHMRLNAAEVQPDEALLAFGPVRARGHERAVATLNLSPAGDLREAASNLFAYLTALDKSGAARIAVEPVPPHGLGEAINDRLARAAAPRP